MSIFKPAFGEIDEADLTELVTSGQVEGVSVEFKRDMYGGSDGDKKEFLKDLSSFTNSAGGHLVIGIDEDQGIATAICPIAGDPDAVLQRLEQIARTAIEPRIVGTQMRAVPIGGVGYCFVIRVPKSWNPPHRVSYQGTNRFYLRSSAGVHEADVDELRALFKNGADMHDRMTSYIAERVAMIGAGHGMVPLAEGVGLDGKLVVHVIPLSAFAGTNQIDVREAQEISHLLQPLGTTGNGRINFDGYIAVRNGTVAHGYTQLFRNGIIEATRVRVASVHDEVARIPMRTLVEQLYARIPSYVAALVGLGVAPPFVVSIAVLGVQGSTLGLHDHWYLDDQSAIERPNLLLPVQTIEDLGSVAQYRSALTPALDALFNAVGYPGAADYLANFNANGVWIG